MIEKFKLDAEAGLKQGCVLLLVKTLGMAKERNPT